MDPIAAQLTKGAIQNKAPKPVAPNYSTDKTGFGSFGDLLNNQMKTNQQSTSHLLEMVDNMMGDTGNSMKAIPAPEVQVSKTEIPDGVQPVAKSADLMELFKEVNTSQNNMSQLIEQLSSGKKLSTQELLSVQVFVHHHTVSYELVSKTGEMVNNAIQRPTQMQV